MAVEFYDKVAARHAFFGLLSIGSKIPILKAMPSSSSPSSSAGAIFSLSSPPSLQIRDLVALFQSLLFEACGRTVNPVNGAIGLLSTGNWQVCQAAVETVLAGGTLRPLSIGALPTDIHEDSVSFRGNSLKNGSQYFNYKPVVKTDPKIYTVPEIKGSSWSFAPENLPMATASFSSGLSNNSMSFETSENSETPKLLNLFV